MVSDVPAGRLARDEDPAEVGQFSEPGVGGASLGAEPKEGGGREAVFRGEGSSCGSRPIAGAEAVAAAVEVVEDGKLGGGAQGEISGLVQAKVEVVGGEPDVLPIDGDSTILARGGGGGWGSASGGWSHR